MRRYLGLALLALSMLAVACSAEPPEKTNNPIPTNQGSSPSAEGATSAEACEIRETDAQWQGNVSASAVVLSEGDEATPKVEAVVYPHPEYEGNPWSQWGQGLVMDDGRYFSAIGDHRGRDGNSYLFEYDPSTKTLTQIMDALTIADHKPGDWGFGKIHAQMVRGPCNLIAVATYWGTRRDIEFSGGYQGDILLQIDPLARTIGNLGVLHPEHGVPSLAASSDGSLLYAEAVDPQGDDTGAFVVQDAMTGTTLFVDDDPSHTGYRSIAVGADGRAYYSIGAGRLAVYDPRSNTRSELDASLPGDWLRAASRPDARGTIYGVTRDPDVFFALYPDGTIRPLGDALGYTTSIALSPDGSVLYSVPDAHGGAWKRGAPLIAVDTATGDLGTLIELGPLAEEGLGLRLGGTYNVAVDELNGTIYIGMNAGAAQDEESFGEVVLLIVTLP